MRSFFEWFGISANLWLVISATLIAVAAAIWVLLFSLRALRKKNCTAEINVIWYAFSLVLVVWGTFHWALYMEYIRLPPNLTAARELEQKIGDLRAQMWSMATPVLRDSFKNAQELDPEEFKKYEQVRKDQRVKVELAEAERELKRKLREGEPWSALYLYQQAKHYLTDTEAEIGLVVAILIVTILPQFFSYVLAGFSGCAATPRYVWQFEKIAIWSLIKFLAAFGGVFVANATRFYENDDKVNDAQLSLSIRLILSLDDLLWGIGAVALAFAIAICQVWILERARELENALQHEPNSLLNRIHRRFTEGLPRAPSGGA